MDKITSINGLRDAIQILEGEQAVKRQQLKEQFLLTYESLRPINLIKSTIKDITSSTDLIDNVLGTVVGLTTGFLSRKIYVGRSGNIIRNLLGSLLQYGVTNIVTNHPDTVRSFAQFIQQRFLRKKERSSPEEDE